MIFLLRGWMIQQRSDGRSLYVRLRPHDVTDEINPCVHISFLGIAAERPVRSTSYIEADVPEHDLGVRESAIGI